VRDPQMARGASSLFVTMRGCSIRLLHCLAVMVRTAITVEYWFGFSKYCILHFHERIVWVAINYVYIVLSIALLELDSIHRYRN